MYVMQLERQKRFARRLDNELADGLTTFDIIYEDEEWARRTTLVVENESAGGLNPFDITYEVDTVVERTRLAVENE